MNNLNWPFIISKFILDFFINSESFIISIDSRYDSCNLYSTSKYDKLGKVILLVFFAFNNNLYKVFYIN